MASQRKLSLVQHEWKPFLKEMDKVQGRRWKASVKQSLIEIVRIREEGIEAKVRWLGGGPGKKTFALRIPTVDWWEPYQYQVATWFARRPDWQADFLAHEWNNELLDFIASAGLRLFPNTDFTERLQKEAVCSCSVPDKPCVHMMAVLDRMMRQMEAEPYLALVYVGLDFPSVLNEAHALAVNWSREQEALGEENEESADSVVNELPAEAKTVKMTASEMKLISLLPEELELIQRLQEQATQEKETNGRKQGKFPIEISQEKLSRWTKNLF